MTDTLGDLLRRSADAAPEPQLDLDGLVAEAGRRQRRRRLAMVATATAAVGAVLVGSFVVRSDQPADVEPAPSPPPSPPTSVAVDPSGTRPLVYAEGATVHVGDDTFDAGGTVVFVDATDDGVVFMTGCSWPRPACTEDTDGEWFSDTLWFNDGSTTKAIGRAPTEHIGVFEVYTDNPGSLVVWADATSRTVGWITRFAVYDTSRQEVVARIPYTGVGNTVLHVDDGHVFFNPDADTPGCWVEDTQYCTAPHLLRYDVASGQTWTVKQAELDVELRSQPRTLDLGRFNQVGRRLVPVDGNGDPTVVRTETGETVELRVPAGYTAPGVEIPVVQWLDDDRIVLFAKEGDGDSPGQVGDLLKCRLPDGLCRVAVASSSSQYLAPG